MQTIKFDIPYVAGAWERWIIILGVVVAVIILALIAHAVLYRVLSRLAARTVAIADSSAIHHTRAAARLLLVVVALWIGWRVAIRPLMSAGDVDVEQRQVQAEGAEAAGDGVGPEQGVGEAEGGGRSPAQRTESVEGGSEEPPGESGEIAGVGLPLEESTLEGIEHFLNVLLIAAVTWLLIRALSIIDDVVVARHHLDTADNLQARRLLTQTKVLSRTGMIIVGVVGFGIILMTFHGVREFGVSLLASAGLAGIVVGFAARPTLSNLIAGIQLALTQPIRLDDVVIVEGEWGRIEEITATYVIVRIWDQRRLVVPLEYFINNPFQNWTRTTADILGTIYLYADYTVPVAEVREELERIVQASEKWDGKVVGLVVTDAKERVMELRALVSAANSGNAWDLRCYVREKLVDYLQREHPGCLPRTRADLTSEEKIGVYLERQSSDGHGRSDDG